MAFLKMQDTLFKKAVADGNLVEIIKFIDNGIDINAEDRNKNVPLHFAFFNSNSEKVLKELIRNEAKVNIQNSFGVAPIHLAILHNSSAMVKPLLDNGANPNVQTLNGFKPLDIIFRLPHIKRINSNVSLLDISIFLRDITAILESTTQAYMEDIKEIEDNINNIINNIMKKD